MKDLTAKHAYRGPFMELFAEIEYAKGSCR